MDYSFEIKNKSNERVAYETITGTTKVKIIERAKQFIERNPQMKNTGCICVITSFDWQKGKRICGVYGL